MMQKSVSDGKGNTFLCMIHGVTDSEVTGQVFSCDGGTCLQSGCKTRNLPLKHG